MAMMDDGDRETVLARVCKGHHNNRWECGGCVCGGGGGGVLVSVPVVAMMVSVVVVVVGMRSGGARDGSSAGSSCSSCRMDGVRSYIHTYIVHTYNMYHIQYVCHTIMYHAFTLPGSIAEIKQYR